METPAEKAARLAAEARAAEEARLAAEAAAKAAAEKAAAEKAAAEKEAAQKVAAEKEFRRRAAEQELAAEESALRAKLAELSLSQFADKLIGEGYNSVKMLAEMNDAELSAVGMGAGHKKKLLPQPMQVPGPPVQAPPPMQQVAPPQSAVQGRVVQGTVMPQEPTSPGPGPPPLPLPNDERAGLITSLRAGGVPDFMLMTSSKKAYLSKDKLMKLKKV